jgi:hypothetical protein
MENRGVEVVAVDFVDDGGETELVGSAVQVTGARRPTTSRNRSGVVAAGEHRQRGDACTAELAPQSKYRHARDRRS